MTSRFLIAPFVLTALLAALSPDAMGPFAPVAAKPDHAEKGGGKANKGGGNKGQGNSGQGNSGQSKNGQANRGKGAAAGGDNAGGQDKRGGTQWQRDWGIDDFLAAGLSAAVVRELLGDHVGALNTGASALPPGIAKNLARGKPLPPGIAKKQPGGALLNALPRIDGHNWLEVGTSLVLIEVGTQIVRDIVHGIFH